MKLFNRLGLALQTWLNDWFEDEALLPESIQRTNVDKLLTQGQAALNLLHGHLAQAVAHQHQVNTQWVQALAQAQALEEARDDDLRAGLPGAARARQVKLLALQDRLQFLKEAVAISEDAVNHLQAVTEALQLRLDMVRKQRTTLNTRAQMVELMLQLNKLERELERNERVLREGLQAQADEVLRKEDWLSAREEWKRK
jgi:hypothetical protein